MLSSVPKALADGFKRKMMTNIDLKVSAIRDLTPGIKSFELVSANGDDLMPFEAGAHIDVFTQDGLRRSYSLANDPAENNRYVLAILREAQGGGSDWMHDDISLGDVVKTSAPVNNFPLDKTAKRHLLIAGGIGITPMLAMGYALKRSNEDFHLHYCTKSPQQTAFLEDVKQVFGEHVTFHHDGGDPAQGIDLKATLAEHSEGAHLYVCGPGGLISATRETASHWPKDMVHFELFSSARTDDEKAEIAALEDEEFEIEIASTGEVLTVPVDKSILEVLGENGIDIIKVCEEGYCGTCQVGLMEGVADHRDEVLDDDEKSSNTLIQVCISRAKGGEKLILDL